MATKAAGYCSREGVQAMWDIFKPTCTGRAEPALELAEAARRLRHKFVWTEQPLLGWSHGEIRRRLLRISAAAACIVVLLRATLVCAQGSQTEAIDALRKTGATFTYDEQSPARPVRGVHFTGSQFAEGALRHLRQFRELQALDLSGMRLSEDDLKDLVPLRKLRELSLRSAHIRPEYFKTLARLTSLETLDLRQTGFTALDPRVLPEARSGRPGEKAFTLVKPEVVPLRQLAALPRLKSLGLGANNLRDEDLQDLTGLKHLQRLSLERNYTDAGVSKLAGLGDLQALELDGTDLTDSGIESISALRTLQKLSLITTKGTEIGLARLGRLVELRTLRLGDTRTTDLVLQQLARLKQLRELDLAETPFSDAGLEALKPHEYLESLRLAGTEITDQGMKAVGALKSLQKLELQFCRRVTDNGLAELAVLKALRFLNVERSGATHRGTENLRTSIPELVTFP